MSSDVAVEQELTWDDVRFGREAKRGVVLGLEKHQLVFLGIGFGLTFGRVGGFGFPLGWLIGGSVLVFSALTALRIPTRTRQSASPAGTRNRPPDRTSNQSRCPGTPVGVSPDQAPHRVWLPGQNARHPR